MGKIPIGLLFPLQVVVATALLSMSCKAELIYSNDFEGVVGSEWSHISTDVTPVGARGFLGQFGNDTISLALSDLPMHSGVTLSFDLFIIRSWDGNYVAPDNPLNLWELQVRGGPTLCRTTFALYPYATEQSYPGHYLMDAYAPRTGAYENNTLGYTFTNNVVIDQPMDSVYRLSLAFAHMSDQLVLDFSGIGLQGPNPWVSGQYLDESWGLDSIELSIDPIPEPSALLTLACGLGVLGGMVWRRRSTREKGRMGEWETRRSTSSIKHPASNMSHGSHLSHRSHESHRVP